MPETIKMVKFKTNVSFVGSDGVFYTGGSVVQLFQEDYDGQVDVCSEFGLPVPELIEEVEAVVQPDQEPEGDKEPEGNKEPEGEKPKGRGKKAAQPEGEQSEGEKAEGDESEL